MLRGSVAAAMSIYERIAPAPPSLPFFFNDTATTEIYTLSLHDALPICRTPGGQISIVTRPGTNQFHGTDSCQGALLRSEEHTSELQSHLNLVCRLLLEKKKTHSHHLSIRTPPHFITQTSRLHPRAFHPS